MHGVCVCVCVCVCTGVCVRVCTLVCVCVRACVYCVGGHTHTMFMDGADVADLKSGKVGTVTLASSMDNAHDHDVIIKYDSAQTFPFAIVSMTNAEGHSLVRR